MIFDFTQDSDTQSWKAELVDGTANFYLRIQDQLDSTTFHEDLQVIQPFYPAGDGTRRNWLTLDSAVTWFKGEN